MYRHPNYYAKALPLGELAELWAAELQAQTRWLAALLIQKAKTGLLDAAPGTPLLMRWNSARPPELIPVQVEGTDLVTLWAIGEDQDDDVLAHFMDRLSISREGALKLASLLHFEPPSFWQPKKAVSIPRPRWPNSVDAPIVRSASAASRIGPNVANCESTAAAHSPDLQPILKKRHKNTGGYAQEDEKLLPRLLLAFLDPEKHISALEAVKQLKDDELPGRGSIESRRSRIYKRFRTELKRRGYV